MGMAMRFLTVCAGAAALLAQPGAAQAAGGIITFSGALVNPSCQLDAVAVPAAQGGLPSVVRASLCGNRPYAFASTVQVSRDAASIGKGIAQIVRQESAAGTVLEVSYN